MRSVATKCLLIALPIFSLHAAEKVKDPAWWINLGMGAGSNFNSGSAPVSSSGGAQLSFNGRFTPHGFLTVYSGGFHKLPDTHNNLQGISELGIMYGYIKRQPSYYLSASTGVCAYFADTTYSYGNGVYAEWGIRSRSGAGISVEGQAFWTPLKHFGLGLIGHSMVAGYPSLSGLLAFQVF